MAARCQLERKALIHRMNRQPLLELRRRIGHGLSTLTAPLPRRGTTGETEQSHRLRRHQDPVMDLASALSTGMFADVDESPLDHEALTARWLHMSGDHCSGIRREGAGISVLELLSCAGRPLAGGHVPSRERCLAKGCVRLRPGTAWPGLAVRRSRPGSPSRRDGSFSPAVVQQGMAARLPGASGRRRRVGRVARHRRRPGRC